MKKITFMMVVSLFLTTMGFAQNPAGYTGKAYPSEVAPAVPCQVIARNWDSGGDGVAFQYPWGPDYGKAGDLSVRPNDNLGVTVWPTDGTGFEQLTSFKSIGNGGEAEKLAWVRYSVNVETAGTYKLTLQYVAGGYEADRLITVDMGGKGAKSDTIISLIYKNSTTNWANGIPADTSFVVDLTAGLHVMTFTNHFQCDFDMVKFDLGMNESKYTGTAYPDGSAPSIPTDVIARNWDKGGQGVAFNWPGGKGGDTSFRPEDNVSVVVWPAGGSEQLTGFKNDIWVKYSVNVSEAGDYALTLSYIAGGGEPETRDGRLVTIDLGGEGNLSDGYIDLIYKNSTQGWANGTPKDTTFNVSLSAGVHAIKIWNRRNCDFDLVKLAVGEITGVYAGTAYPDGVPPAMPGEVIARNWDKGGEGVAFHYPFAEFGKAGDPTIRPTDLMGVAVWPEVGGQEQLTSFRATSNDGKDAAWVKYSVNVTKPGIYDFTLSYIAYGSEPVDVANRLVSVDLGGEGQQSDAMINLVYKNSTEGFFTGDGIPADTTFKVVLTAGKHVIKITNNRNSDFNLVRFKIAVHPYDGTAYPNGTPPTMPGELLARNWDNGGEGVAFHWPWGDGKAGNADKTIRSDENMSITVWPAGGFEQLSGLKSPDNTGDNPAWVRYTVNVPNAGDYDFTISYIAGGNEPVAKANRLVAIDMGGQGENSDAKIELVYKNSADGWANGIPADTTFVLPLTKGIHVIEIANHRACDFNLVKFGLVKHVYTGTAYPDGIPPVVPCEVLARNWDNGGQGEAFFWSWGKGSKIGDLTVRPGEDMSVVVWPAGGFEQLTGFKNNAWVKYTVETKYEGNYVLALKYIFGGAEEDRLISIDMGGEDAESDTIISLNYARSTEGWADGTPADTSFTVHLTKGIHSIKFTNPRNADFDLISFSLAVPTGIDPAADIQDGFKVYPTLVSDKLTIQLNGKANSTIYIRNLSGITVKVLKTNNPMVDLNVSGLASGIYFVTIDKTTKRFIKK
jgi:hypothetical protein